MSGPCVISLPVGGDLPIGAPIEGSRYVRDYCCTCNEPIRVVEPSVLSQCDACRRGGLGVHSPHPMIPRSELVYNGSIVKDRGD